MTYYDDNFKSYKIEIKRGYNGVHYVYVNNKFYCSADNINEAEDEVNKYIKENSLKSFFEVI